MITQPLVSICIPTYNRQQFLDRQIKHLVKMLERHWDTCELVVSDNASTDGTQKICEQWQSKLVGVSFKAQRQKENIGAVNNCRECLKIATGKYLWIVSDDDNLYDGVVDYIIDTVKSDPSITFLHLNHRCVKSDEVTVIHDRYYPWTEDQKDSDGRKLIEKAIQHEAGGVYFISAGIVNRQYAMEAASQWKNGTKNLIWPMFLYAYAATKGTMVISSQPLLDCVYQRGSWTNSAMKLYFHDEQELYVKLIELGYDRKLIKSLAINRLANMRFRDYGAIVKRLLIPHPLLSLQALIYQIRLLVII